MTSAEEGLPPSNEPEEWQDTEIAYVASIANFKRCQVQALQIASIANCKKYLVVSPNLLIKQTR